MVHPAFNHALRQENKATELFNMIWGESSLLDHGLDDTGSPCLINMAPDKKTGGLELKS